MVHGRGGKRNTNWPSWLEKELKAKGYNVVYPAFPNPQRPVMKEWYQEFKKHRPRLEKDSIIVAYALGTIFTFYLLERLKTTISKTILVAPPATEKKPLNQLRSGLQQRLAGREDPDYIKTFNQDLEEIKSFVEQDFDWKNVQSRSKDFVFYFSTNDHHVPFKETVDFYSKIFEKASIKKLVNQGHVNEKAGIFTLLPVLEEITNPTP